MQHKNTICYPVKSRTPLAFRPCYMKFTTMVIGANINLRFLNWTDGKYYNIGKGKL